MGILQIGLFGGVRVTHNNWLTEVKLTREIQALLAYLGLQRHRVHSREILAGIFWGEYSQQRARGSLNTALWKLKKALEPEGVPAGTYLKNNHPGEVGLNRESQYWLDVEVFEVEIKRILICPFQTAQESHAVELENTLELYKGELLEGFYDNWALRERERLRALYVKSLVYLLQYYGFHGGYEKAITYGQQILGLDLLREEIHRAVMRFYMENGQRAMAVKQYEICRLALAKELDIAPMKETQALHTFICTETDSGRMPKIPKDQISFDQAIEQLREANQTIDLAKEKIEHAYQLIAKFLEHLE